MRHAKVIEFLSSVRSIPLPPCSTMPLPSSENDLKRRARRRLIGAVALTLLAVTVLPLLLEDEPPPASSLAVRMAVAPAPAPDQATPASQKTESGQTVASTSPAAPLPEVRPGPEPVKSEPVKSEPAKPAPKSPPPKPEPVKSEPVKPAPKPQAPKPAESPAVEAKPAAAGEMYVVQLAALSDAAKAQALKTRAAKLGLPAFTDKLGSLTRVRVGPYPSREAAVAAAAKLAESKMAGQVISQ
jgi:DedD protein